MNSQINKIMLVLTLICVSIFSAFAQTLAPKTKSADEVRGTIFGTVFDETGTAISDALVSLAPIGSRASGEYVKILTDRDGKFSFENLKPRRYKISVRFAGYVLPEQFEISSHEQKTYLIDQEVNLTLKKGGIITGKVSGADNQPIIQIRVRAVKIRDEFGQRIPAQEFYRYSQQNFTDDRGIYRLFGLSAGDYLVFVGGEDVFSGSDLKTKGGSPVFHPSNSIDAAREISVGYGRETNAIDINFREIQGFTISGSVSGAKADAANNGGVEISLVNAANGVEAMQTVISPQTGKYAFEFEQIPNGEYEIRAFQFNNKGIFSRNSLQKINVKGADISGVKVDLKSLASIKGNVTLEKNPALKTIRECTETAHTAVAVTVIKFDSSRKERSILDPLERNFQNALAAPDEKGDFELNGLESGKYFLNAGFSDKNLYVKEFFRQISSKEKRSLNDLNLTAGENADNIKIIVSDGAAQINGKINISDETAFENRAEKQIVYLIPADEENKDNVLLYQESAADANDNFSFANIRPGNYFLLIENIPIDSEKVQEVSIPKFFDAAERSKLYQAAKEKKVEALKLQPCQNSLIEIEK